MSITHKAKQELLEWINKEKHYEDDRFPFVYIDALKQYITDMPEVATDREYRPEGDYSPTIKEVKEYCETLREQNLDKPCTLYCPYETCINTPEWDIKAITKAMEENYNA